MLKTIFTLDYEIHGNGQGSSYDLMVEPTDRLLKLFDYYGAKLTIFADIAEIIKFKEYRDKYGSDDYYYDAIVEQLKRAIKTGHDVQLHIHSSYFNSSHKKGQWCQDWSEYNFADLPYERINWMIKTGKEFLESILQPVNKSYKCIAFRAANWSVSPSGNVARALLENNIAIDTSIFKYGRRNGLASFDYSSAYHSMTPWQANYDNLCQLDPNSEIWEFPIYSENRWITAFFSTNRIYRLLLGSLHRIPKNNNSEKKYFDSKNKQTFRDLIFKRNAWKADFNQCSGRQLIRAMVRAEKNISQTDIVPFTLIGHSKIFTRWNEISIKPYLDFIVRNPNRFGFATFNMFKI